VYAFWKLATQINETEQAVVVRYHSEGRGLPFDAYGIPPFG
jgi:hypothetical protein